MTDGPPCCRTSIGSAYCHAGRRPANMPAHNAFTWVRRPFMQVEEKAALKKAGGAFAGLFGGARKASVEEEEVADEEDEEVKEKVSISPCM
jgi:hypothetical protein